MARELLGALDELAREGELFAPNGKNELRCLACAHRCLIAPGGRGRCRVRFNRAGRLMVPWGYTTGLSADPIEKKPFYHFLPGSTALSYGLLGCNLQCEFCQNWHVSQALREPEAGAWPKPVTPAQIAAAARRCEARSLASTYNEPLISSEWSRAVFREGRRAGLAASYVSNGFATPEVLDYLRGELAAMNVDLKAFREESYRRLGGELAPVCDTIRWLHEHGIWVEVVTLLVPGFNDEPQEWREMARFLAGISPGIPWHLSAYHGAYRHAGRPGTPPELLRRAAEEGRAAGLRHVYLGNLRGPEGQDTLCPACGALLVERRGWQTRLAGLAGGACGGCGEKIGGVWGDKEE